jgi:hypothetical protein
MHCTCPLLGVKRTLVNQCPPDPSWQTSAIKNLKLTESLFANECEPFFNSIDPMRTSAAKPEWT